jgi:hypothetical protein
MKKFCCVIWMLQAKWEACVKEVKKLVAAAITVPKWHGFWKPVPPNW